MLPDWIFDDDEVPASKCIRLPSPYAILCARGVWRSIAVADIPQHFVGWRVLPQVAKTFNAAHQVHGVMPFGANVAYDAAQELRHIAQGMNADDEMDRDHLDILHQVAAALQSLHDELDPVAMHANIVDLRGVPAHKHGKAAYHATFLVQCLAVCNLLRDSGNLRLAIKYAVALTLPPSMARLVTARIDAEDGFSFHLPHKSTLSRARMALDVGYMCFIRELNHRRLDRGVVRYAMLDSSPQGHRDFLLINITTIDKVQLHQMLLDTNVLQQFWEGEDLQDQNAQRQEALILRRVQDNIDVHALPPMVIGSGRGTLAMKFHAFMFAQFLECKSAWDLSLLASELIAITSDQGVEFGVTRLEPIDVAALFPWSQQDGVGGDDDYMFAPLADAPIPPRIDLTGCVGIAGLLHIIHNSSADLESAMGTYKDTVRKLKHVANLVRRHATKDRLLNSCFNEGPALYMRRELQKFDGKVYENRWGTVAHCIIETLKLEHALRFGWSLQKYGSKQRAE
jgi:hypothetical protein